MTSRGAKVFLCECGPILSEGLDLDDLAVRVAADPDAIRVDRHATLCSPEGKEWLTQQMAMDPERRVVIAACSPREHGETFAAAARDAGLNPYLLALAPIREQAAWVTPNRDEATEKALRLVLAALRRVQAQEALEEKHTDCLTDVLVLGAGVAGLSAARLLAEAGRRVTLVESSAAVGGQAALLSDIYPSGECASCLLEPLMDEVLHHENVELLTLARLEALSGFVGNFTARIHVQARPVDPQACYGCHGCHDACPVELDNPFDAGLSKRKAIGVPYTGALPNVSVIDLDACLRAGGGTCQACADACPFGAIDLAATESLVERRVGAVIVATGGHAALPEPWQGDTRVLHATTLERMLSSAGPTGGKVALPGLEPPRTIALVLDPGDSPSPHPAEDSRLRSLVLGKLCDLLRRKLPDIQLYEIAFVYGPHSAASSSSARHAPTRLWLSPSDELISVDEHGARLRLNFTRRGKPDSLDVDMAMILPPISGGRGNTSLGSRLGLSTDRSGFFQSCDAVLSPQRSSLDGVYLAGCARAPMTVAESAGSAAAAAGEVLSALVPGRRLPLTPTSAQVSPELCGRCRTCLLACPFQAVHMDPETGSAWVNELLCRGCGSCAAACPSGAISALHFSDGQLLAELSELIQGSVSDGNESPGKSQGLPRDDGE